MEDSKTIEKIMKIVEENLELSVKICYTYGFISTGDALNKALLALADAKVTREYEQSQRIELQQQQQQIDERLKEQNTVNEPIDLTPEEADELMAKFGQPESEESNGC